MDNQRILINYSIPELHQFFRVPDRDKSSAHNENLAGFMVLLLQILDHEAPSFLSCHGDLYNLLQKKLTFLLTFLGDTPFQCTKLEDIKNLFVEFESLANEAGSFIYSCVSSSSEEVRNNIFAEGIQALLEKVDTFLNEKIKEHCFKELPKTATSRSGPLHSLFIIDSLLEDLQGLLDGRFNLAIDDIEFLIKTLIEELTFFQAFLKDIEMLQLTHDTELKESLIQMRDTAYEAEYLINTYILGHIPGWYLNLRLPNVVQKIKHTQTRLQEIGKTSDVKRRKIMNEFASGVSFEVIRNSGVLDDNIVMGFEDTGEKILADLIGGPKKLKLICIFGMPGIGKTTIAKKLYDSRSVHDHFDLRVWCVVSTTYEKKKVLRDILMSLGSKLDQDNILQMGEESLVLEIFQSLFGRRYLVIIDDIWYLRIWLDLRKCFADNGNGSRILFTSRIKDTVPSDSIFHEPPLLSESQCLDLLLKKVFLEATCPPELLRIAKGMALKCQGLPLTVVVVAGILKNLVKEQSVWKDVEQNLDLHLSNDQSTHILGLSYEHLPNHLKPCFLYLGAFQQGQEIPPRKLIPMWIAEGFVHKEERKTLEHIAEEYIFDLINRSLLIITKRKSDGGIKACRIHDLLRDMCLRKAEEEKFLKHITKLSTTYENHSHLALYSQPSNTCSVSALHSRSFLGYISALGHSITQMPLLRVIDRRRLHKYHFLDEMRRICGLVHLRYLSFQDALPEDICKLVNLEYLHLDTDSTLNVPSSILKMVKLRNVHITAHAVFQKNCDISTITNNLKYLSCVLVKNNEEEEILKCSPHLHKLKCVCDIWFPDLISLTDLRSLNISVFNNPLRGELSKVNFPSTLRKLTLSGTRLLWEETSAIGRLPNLNVLKLLNEAFGGTEWRTRDDEFPELRFLKLDTISSLQQWTTCGEHFPKLERLVLDRVWVRIPPEFCDIATLHTIEVRNCKDEAYASAIEIEEEQREYGNEDFKIITSGFDKEGINQTIELPIVEEDETSNYNVPQLEEDGDNTISERLFDIIKIMSPPTGFQSRNIDLSDTVDVSSSLYKQITDPELAINADEVDKGERVVDELVAKELQDFLNLEMLIPRLPLSQSPGYDYGSFFPPNPFYSPSGHRICSGCYREIGYEGYFRSNEYLWHRNCFRCYICDIPIWHIDGNSLSILKFIRSAKGLYHVPCGKEMRDPKCDVCKKFVPVAESGLIEYQAHSFWHHKYCPSHSADGTPRCFSCGRLKPVDATYVIIDGDREACLECLDLSIMDTNECQDLYLEVREFYEGLNMKVEQEFPLLLVESQALSQAMEGEKNGCAYLPGTKGACLFEEQTVETILRRPIISGDQITDMFTEPWKLVRNCEVTAILVLFGLPRLLTGILIADKMMNAWLRLQDYQNLSEDVEEGMCEVLALMWLDYATSGSANKGKQSEFENRLGLLYKLRIESDASATDSFREANEAVREYGLSSTLDHIRLTGNFPS